MTISILAPRSVTRRATALLSLFISIFMLAACATNPMSPMLGGGASLGKARQLAEAGEHQQAASMYVQLAGKQTDVSRDRFMLFAVQQWVLAGDERRARVAMAKIAEPQSQPLLNDWHLTQGALHILRGDGMAALSELEDASASDFSLNQRIVAERIRGDGYFLTDQPLEAVRTLHRRELWLNSSDEIADNHQHIWDGLLQVGPATLRTAFGQAQDADVKGWLALGSLADGSLAGGPVAGIGGWRQQFPDHPAMRFIVPGIIGNPANAATGEPQQIALLLTLSGRTGIVGQAVRDGFLSHYSEHYRSRIDAPVVRVYDIAEAGATLAYQRAIEDGADFVIGPVLRSPVDELANSYLLTARTLFLNYLADQPETALPVPLQVYQFGLAPEDEARSAARRAFAEGHRRAIALVPASDWGDRVLNAFNSEFEGLGGSLLDFQNFIATEPDYKNEIQTLMLLNDSVARYREMRNTLGEALQFEPRRRADADFIFLGATSDSAQRMKPQLRFHYSGDLPVYATSAVYNARTSQSSRDLNGIRFSDVRWLVSRMNEDITPLQTTGRFFSAARSQPRLFALGYDAFAIMRIIVSPDESNDIAYKGATGDLTLDYGRVSREPVWAVFDGEQPIPLPALTLPRADPSLLDIRSSSPDDDLPLSE